MKNNYIFSICIKMFLLNIFVMFGGHLYADGIRIVNPTKPLQAQFSEPNTVYVINETCDLKGQALIFPEGAVIRFDGGKLTNGAILKSRFLVEATRIKVFDNICFSTIEDDNLRQVDPVHVRVLSNDAFLNIETDEIAKKGDVVNIRSLYRIIIPTKTTSNGDGTRKVKIEEKEYVVSDTHGNYTYPTRSIVGIDIKARKMLKSAVIDRGSEIFFKVTPVKQQNISTLLNREVFPEWFGCTADAVEDQSSPLNYCVDVATNSRSIVILTSGKYRIAEPVIVTTNTKIIGVDSSPWNVCTNLSVETNNGLIVFDEKGCNNVLLEGLSFSAHSNKWIEEYIGIEVRTSIQGMVLKNISCFQPQIGIYFHAYSDLLSASIDNYKQLSGVYGVVMRPLFETTFKSSYCNGNRVDIGTGGSALLKKNAVYVKNCEGNSISYNAGEQYGNPSVYCDNSIITLSGITWHEESIFLQAVNHSEVTILGELYAMGSIIADGTSAIHYSNIIDSHYWHNKINPNYQEIDLADSRLLLFDAPHAAYLDEKGNVLLELSKDNVKYVNGNPYCIKTNEKGLTVPFNEEKGLTIFIRISSSGDPKKGKPSISINGCRLLEFTLSNLFPVCCIVSTKDNMTLGYLTPGESILSFRIDGSSVCLLNGKPIGTINSRKDSITIDWNSANTTSLLVSDILLVDNNISDIINIKEYERFVKKNHNISIPNSGSTRPLLTKSYAGFLFYDERLGCLILWNGDNWVNINSTITN